MVFGHIITSPRGNLSIQKSLDLANLFLENAEKAQDRDIALVLCHETEAALSHAKKASKHADGQTVRQGIGIAYIGLGRVLERQELIREAQEIYKKAEKMGVNVQEQAQSSGDLGDTPVNSLDPSTAKSTPPATLKKRKQVNDIPTLPSSIFTENLRPPIAVSRLPDPDERLSNTPQLVCSLALLKNSHSLDDILEPSARNWLQAVENDEDEQERLKVLATDVIRTFKKEEIKDAKAVAEVVCLVPVLEKDAFRDLLLEFYNGIDHSGLLDLHQLEGIAQLIQDANPGYLLADDLVKILSLLSTRLRDTHKQSPQHMYQLTLAASHVLDAMADCHVEGLDRETLHEPLLSYLDSLKGHSDPFLMYQVAYAYQALLCVPDNESLWQATLRRTGKVVRGVSGLVSAVKSFDLSGFVDGLKEIQQGISGASEVVKVIVTAFDDVKSLTAGGKGFLDGLRDGLSFNRKCAWYPALRGADGLIRDGEFATFKQLVCEAPCRLDPAFQWGVCQRLGEIAINTTWDVRTRRSAVAFLVEIYRNDDDWGHQLSIKEWIAMILMRLASSTGSISQFADSLLQELEENSDAKGRELLQECRKKNSGSYPLKLALPPLASPSLLDRVQNKPDVEASLRLLRKQRLKERGDAVYIHPQAKAGLQSSDDARFPLMENVKEFLESDRKVFLLLGDSGAGKSTFNRQLECDLWTEYKKNTGRIPLHINLPAIEKSEQDMIAKQLRKSEFTESEIRELKVHRKFILICDGYDESQQTHNLYMSNRLNQEGEWKAQMIISCRSEYLGVDYRDRFQPGDRNRLSESGKFQEAVITPFSEGQVHDYIKQYVSLCQPLWEAKEYTRALDLIPSLKDLVKNPFLMTLSLEVLPRMMDPGEQLSATSVTQIALYDQFVEHWLERGKKRLGEKELSPQAKAAFEGLVEEGFTRNGIDFLKRLAVAIYKEQRGQPVVQYSRFRDQGTWKSEFFSRDDEKQILREACPLTRSGNQHRFIHRSLLEYGVALAIFDPHDWRERSVPTTVLGRRGSTDSAFSFRIDDSTEDYGAPMDQAPDPNSPLTWRYFLNDPSILEFLKERVQQQPIFKQQLLNYVEHSKVDVKWREAAANAMTILIRAEVRFNGADLRGIRIPGADLSHGMFDYAQLQGADLRQVNLRGVWLRQADLSEALMAGAQFGEGPFLTEDDEVFSCAYSPDGKSLAVGLSSGAVHMYSTSSWEEVEHLMGHSSTVRSVMYSPNGKQLASGSSDTTVLLWDIETGSLTLRLTGHSNDINDIAYSPSGNALASASDDRTVRVWNVETGKCRQTLSEHTAGVSSVAYSPEGHQIASSSGDMTIRLWDVDSGECRHILSDLGDTAWSVRYSPLGNYLAFCSSDSTISLWDVKTGDCRRILNGHEDSVASIAFSPQGDVIASCSVDNTARLWDVETGDCRQVLVGHTLPARCVAFSPKGDYFTTVSDDQTVRLWIVGTGTERRQVSRGHSEAIERVRSSPQGHQVASCSTDNTTRLWDVETGTCRHILTGHRRWVRSIDYSPHGDLILSGGDDGEVYLWDVETGECRQSYRHEFRVGFVVYSPQETQFASSDADSAIRLWNVESGECTHILLGHTIFITGLVYSPDGNKLASGGWDERIRLWDAKNGDCLHTMTGYSILDIAFSPRGNAIASVGTSVQQWDVDTGECRFVSIGHSDDIDIVTYSPDGSQVASSSYDTTARLWDTETGECIHTLTGHTDRISSIKYSPDGRQILSVGMDVAIRLWDVSTGQCLAMVLQDFNGAFRDVAWVPSPNVSRFTTATDEGSIHLWQVTEIDGRYHVQLCWASASGILSVRGTSIQGVRGLNQLSKQLLKQRGAEGEPFHPLREAIDKVIRIGSVLSKLKQASSEKVSGTSVSTTCS